MPDPRELNLPWVESPFFDFELDRRPDLTEDEREMSRRFHRDGFLRIPHAVPDNLCDEVRAAVEPLFDDPAAVANRRVQDVWRDGHEVVRRLATDVSIQAVLEKLYGRRPIPFQTLDFKWGTQQRGHSDSVHFSCMPARYMCGVWVALEDVGPDNGPLFYFPGSHRLPELNGFDLGSMAGPGFYDRYEEVQDLLMGELGIEPLEFHAAKGDALVWSSNLVHGGRPVNAEGSTRWSQVTHYFFADCVYFQPHSSEFPTGEWRLLDVTDLNTLAPVQPNYNGHPVWIEPTVEGRSRISFRPPEAPPTPAAEPAPAAKAAAGGRNPILQATIDELSRSDAGRRVLSVARSARSRLGPTP